MAKKALGKGLEAIISTSSSPATELEKGITEAVDRIVEIEVNKIKPNPEQPREHFDEEELSALADSIQQVGMLQPIIVRKTGKNFTVVAGERRLRATKLAGLKKIRAIVIETGEIENLTFALIENIQRSNLDPIEEAKAYQVLADRFKMKQQEIAKKVGKERATIANLLRLLNLPDEMQKGLSEGTITIGHAKILLSLKGSSQKELYRETVNKGLSVRALEQRAGEITEKGGDAAPAKPPKDPHIRKMEEGLESILGTKVEIKHSGNKGRIEISYYSLDDFDRIMELLKN